ncbi:MAG: type II toxin-antitoxin system VapC family toxin [Chloroflexi bacterium]|nr:type II toxin-antitoxin system VapC family toxin [Chloroflexota bacterium]
MTDIYAESSAVLRWLLGAPNADQIEELLASAARITTSAITSPEVGRTLRRLVATQALSPEARDRAWVRFKSAIAHWTVYAVTDEVLARVSEVFPGEPLRTVDAIHLATAAQYGAEIGVPLVVSTDDRVKRNALGLGLLVSDSL